MEFLVKAGIWRIVYDEFAALSKFQGMIREYTYDRWVCHRATFRDSIQKAIELDPEPLVNFEAKVRRQFQNDMIDRAVSEFKRNLKVQWNMQGDFRGDEP